MIMPQKPRTESSRPEQPAKRLGAKTAPRELTDADRKRYLETMKQQAKLHRRTLAALAK